MSSSMAYSDKPGERSTVLRPVKLYGPPHVPQTPSKTINTMMETRFYKQFDSLPKYLIALYVCSVFRLITWLYVRINPDRVQHSHTYWMVSCGVFAALLSLAAIIVYHLMAKYSLFFLIEACINYAKFIVFAAYVAFGVGICIAGMIFFDKDGAPLFMLKQGKTFANSAKRAGTWVQREAGKWMEKLD